MTLQQKYHHALQCHGSGDLPSAARLYREILATVPGHAGALQHLGVVAFQSGHFATARDLIQRAIELDPECAGAYLNLGAALNANGQTDLAILALRQAIALKPDYAEAHNNLGAALVDNDLLDQAVASYRRALSLKPDYAEAHFNLANALIANMRFDPAEQHYRQAIGLRPDYAEAHNNLAAALADQGLMDQAIAGYRTAIVLKPTYAEAHENLGMMLLLRGDLPSGWSEYEWRLRKVDRLPLQRRFSVPMWDGQFRENCRLLIHAEQGFGDTIQFARYLPLLAAQGQRVVFQCQPQLLNLLKSRTDLWQTISVSQPLPEFDFHCPLLSVPKLLQTTMQSIPAEIPYLQADPISMRYWTEQLSSGGHRFNVGLVWSGSPTFKRDPLRSPRELSLFAPLAELEGVQFVSLQKGPAASQTQRPPPGMQLIDWTEKLNDFADTAALIANMDLVISSDTSVAHLAGAMGKPVWVMLPFNADWRWLLDRSDSPWYPTMRLFRQTRASVWTDVVLRIRDELSALTLSRPLTPEG